jgi:hypothetical protein
MGNKRLNWCCHYERQKKKRTKCHLGNILKLHSVYQLFFLLFDFLLPIIVIGQKVNIAARMMMYYPGIVTCDSVTYNGSNLPPYFFKELPKKVMKGVGDSGPIYQCLGLNEKV